jgi:predicted transposase/invertase (TIGR01784 family)
MTTKTKIHTPHDRYFRTVMSDLKIAKEFFHEYLPEDIRNMVDLNTLKLCKESFIDKSLHALITDMLFSVNFADEPGYLYFLNEHESSPDKLLSFWLLKYMVEIMDKHLTENKTKVLPVVYPIIYYNGRVSYPFSTDIFDLFGKFKEFAKTVFLKPFQIIDLTKIPDEDLYKQKWTGIMSLMMKHIRKRDIMNYFADAIPLLKHIENLGGGQYIETTIFYILNAAEIKDRKAFINIINEKLSPEFGEKAMTLAQQFKAEGRAEGKAEGKAEGQVETKHIIAYNMLQSNIELSLIKKFTGLSLKEIQNLKEKHA